MKVSGYIIQAKDEFSMDRMQAICLNNGVTFTHDSYLVLCILESNMTPECEQELRASNCYTRFKHKK